jgi:adenylate cyclase, class 2
MNYQELELKYFVADLPAIEKRLIGLGAELYQERVREINLRFDTPDFSLSRAGKALRLRFDTQARLTFKGPSEDLQGVRLRQEIEFVADNFQAAQAFIIALGYQISMIYEKFRSGYTLGGVSILLDELPFGNFIEIEGSNPDVIREVNDALGLHWDLRISESYTVLFERVRSKLQLPFRDLVFENFEKLDIQPMDLGVQPADL